MTTRTLPAARPPTSSRPRARRRAALVRLLMACMLPACGAESVDERCFPVPPGLAVARTGLETQSTGLQGGRSDHHENQGTGLQGGHPIHESQGTSLQGGSPIHEHQGTGHSCAAGVIAKCVAWGYGPWAVGADVHAACRRMARADYCGDGTAWTMDGTAIDAFDSFGVQPRGAAGPMVFEAPWSPAGATCAARTRYAIRDGSGAILEPRCIASLPGIRARPAAD